MSIVVFWGGSIQSGRGSAIGNLEQTTFYANRSGDFMTIPTYYLFMFFIIVGIFSLLWGMFVDKEN